MHSSFSQSGKVEKVQLERLLPNPMQGQSPNSLPEEKLRKLIQEMERPGSWVSLLGRSASHGAIEIAYGEHRLAAARRLGLQEIEVIVLALSDEDMRSLAALESHQGRGLRVTTVLAIVDAAQTRIFNLLKLGTNDGTLQEFLKNHYPTSKGIKNAMHYGPGEGPIMEYLGGMFSRFEIRIALKLLKVITNKLVDLDAINMFEELRYAEAFADAVLVERREDQDEYRGPNTSNGTSNQDLIFPGSTQIDLAGKVCDRR